MIEHIMGEDFVLLSLMNSYLETPSAGDLFYAEFFQNAFTSFQKNKRILPEEDQIPKILHFIWIGQKKFPAESLKNLKSWQKHHPDWRIFFWTDNHQPPLPEMEVKQIEAPGRLASYYIAATNPAERADYLRYAILHKWGGIYVDHDVKCLRNFEGLAKTSSFFAIQSHGFSNPFVYRFGNQELLCRFLMDNGILGSRKGLALWDAVFTAAENTWDFYTEKWKHYEPICILHRSLLPLTLGIIEYIHLSKDPRIAVLPKICQYPHAFPGPIFKNLLKQWSYCKNQHAKSWIEKYDREHMNAVWRSSLELAEKPI